MHKSELLDFAQIDMINQQAGKFATQNIRALLADRDDLDRLAFSEELAGMIARKTRGCTSSLPVPAIRAGASSPVTFCAIFARTAPMRCE